MQICLEEARKILQIAPSAGVKLQQLELLQLLEGLIARWLKVALVFSEKSSHPSQCHPSRDLFGLI